MDQGETGGCWKASSSAGPLIPRGSRVQLLASLEGFCGGGGKSQHGSVEHVLHPAGSGFGAIPRRGSDSDLHGMRRNCDGRRSLSGSTSRPSLDRTRLKSTASTCTVQALGNLTTRPCEGGREL